MLLSRAHLQKTSLTSGFTAAMTSNVEDLVREGCQVIEVDKAAHRAVGPRDVRINRMCCSEVMDSNEIRLAVEKRFKGKRTLYEDPCFRELVAWCLGTDSYKLCEKNIERVSDVDIELAWQFIDTTSVSSTKSCREIMGRYKSARSAVGFRREHIRTSSRASPYKPLTRNAVPSTLARHTKKDSDGYDTLEEMMVEDCMQWVLRSPDPTSSALQLRSRLLQRHQGREDLRAHWR